jgi:hypothetical protein
MTEPEKAIQIGPEFALTKWIQNEHQYEPFRGNLTSYID